MPTVASCIAYAAPVAILVVYGASLHVFIYYFCQHHVKNFAVRITYIVISALITIMLVWSLWQTIMTRNDEVYSSYSLSEDEYEKLMRIKGEDARSTMLVNIIVKRGLMVYMCSDQGRVRFCTTCQLIKPDRAHHCSTCDTCILKMDHHCPWVNNCVGFRNYKMFLLTLIYGSMYCYFNVCCSLRTFLVFCTKKYDEVEYIIIAVGFIAAVVIGLIVSIFAIYHFYLVINNETTIEYVHGPTFVEDQTKVTFDLGCRKNVASIFGWNMCLWMIPVFSAEGDGHNFELRETDCS